MIACAMQIFELEQMLSYCRLSRSSRLHPSLKPSAILADDFTKFAGYRHMTVLSITSGLKDWGTDSRPNKSDFQMRAIVEWTTRQLSIVVPQKNSQLHTAQPIVETASWSKGDSATSTINAIDKRLKTRRHCRDSHEADYRTRQAVGAWSSRLSVEAMVVNWAIDCHACGLVT